MTITQQALEHLSAAVHTPGVHDPTDKPVRLRAVMTQHLACDDITLSLSSSEADTLPLGEQVAVAAPVAGTVVAVAVEPVGQEQVCIIMLYYYGHQSVGYAWSYTNMDDSRSVHFMYGTLYR